VSLDAPFVRIPDATMPRMRTAGTLLVLVAALAVVMSGCGGAGAEDTVPTAESASGAVTPAAPEPTADPGFSPDDEAQSILPDSVAAEDRLIKRLGVRTDFRVHRAPLAALEDGPLVAAVTATMRRDLTPDDPGVRRLNSGQRALFAMWWADAEVLNGGFDQFLRNDTGALAADLVPAAKQVGSPEYEAVFRGLTRRFAHGHIPRDRSARIRALDRIPPAALDALDQRYFAFQYQRSTAIAPILARYVRTFLNEFAAD
jgi:hypothetical protein